MAKQKLRKYELIYLVQPEATDEEREKVAARVQHALEGFDAKVLRTEDWGKRKLAYEIQKHNKAYYTYMVYVAAPGATAEVERVLRMMDPCVRFQHIKLEEGLDPDAEYAPEAPTPAGASSVGSSRRFHDEDDEEATDA
jgi:small subunit ribosomal protein S6